MVDALWGQGVSPVVSEEQITWLRWENEHPAAVYLLPEGPSYDVWNLKESLLRGLCRASSLDPYQDELVELLLGVVRRRQERLDHYYSRLALRLDRVCLRAGLASCLGAADEGTRVRAAWLLDVLDHPDVPPTRARWLAWTAAHGLPRRLDRAHHAEDDRDRIHLRRRTTVSR
ncbi:MULTISPECIES: hypothetical protein [unclassified Isoptericola]|uniref:hypothetical protein n=1 Tax=unclassified Isoptericola TaxID=2623355 RepID=UPI003669FFD0